MIPSQLSSKIGQLDPDLTKVLESFKFQIEKILISAEPILITCRIKSGISIMQKLHTGKYPNFADIDDLIGVKVVLLNRKQLQQAINLITESDLIITRNVSKPTVATDFSYREPKLYIQLNKEFQDLNPQLGAYICELQFTTGLQHILDDATHDFDYKGNNYSWSNIRLVAQLRGMLELVDRMIDDPKMIQMSNFESVNKPDFQLLSEEILSVTKELIDSTKLADDGRRYAETVSGWAKAVGIDSIEFGEMVKRNLDLFQLETLDITSAVLGAFAREHLESLIQDSEIIRFFVTPSLEDFCPPARKIPINMRVSLDKI
jgi:ppGpp synthetase/RelA/SpoT-type nucleotidyltranferase